jgi:hypothetical protein
MTSVSSEVLTRRPTRVEPTPRPSSPITYPVNIDIPLHVGAFNTAEGWARDVSADIAREVLACARESTMNCQLPCAPP